MVLPVQAGPLVKSDPGVETGSLVETVRRDYDRDHRWRRHQQRWQHYRDRWYDDDYEGGYYYYQNDDRWQHRRWRRHHDRHDRRHNRRW
jgi:hypothetical protein